MCWEISKPASRTHREAEDRPQVSPESSSWSGLQETLLKYLLLSNKRPTTHPQGQPRGQLTCFLLSDPWVEGTQDTRVTLKERGLEGTPPLKAAWSYRHG